MHAGADRRVPWILVRWVGARTRGRLAVRFALPDCIHSDGDLRGIVVSRVFAVDAGISDRILAGGNRAGRRIWSATSEKPGRGAGGRAFAGSFGLLCAFTLSADGKHLVRDRDAHRRGIGARRISTGCPTAARLARGHLLNSSFHGPEWLTGGSVGPEGSCVRVCGAAAFGGDYPFHVSCASGPLPDSRCSWNPFEAMRHLLWV